VDTFAEKPRPLGNKKFRKEHSGEEGRPNFMRQYYDALPLGAMMLFNSLLASPAYLVHKQKKISGCR
jgi:hypothetical protein